jgi:hypothetical protein
MPTYNVQYIHDIGVLTIPVEADNQRDAQLLASTFRDDILEGGFGPINDIRIEESQAW